MLFAATIFRNSGRLASLEQQIRAKPVTAMLNPKDRLLVDESLPRIRSDCEEIQLTFSVLQIDRMAEELGKSPRQYGWLAESIKALRLRLEDELAVLVFFRVPPDRTRFLDAEATAYIRARFPSAAFDLEEASHCL